MRWGRRADAHEMIQKIQVFILREAARLGHLLWVFMSEQEKYESFTKGHPHKE